MQKNCEKCNKGFEVRPSRIGAKFCSPNCYQTSDYRKLLTVKQNKRMAGEKRKPCSEETKKNISLSKIGKKMREEQKRKISDTMKRFCSNPAVREKMSNVRKGVASGMKGKKMPLEFREAVAERLKGTKRPPFSEEWKNNIRNAVINNPPRVFKETKIELKIESLLQDLGVSYVKQFRVKDVGVADFYIPKSNLIIECDGCYWHRCENCGFEDNCGKRLKDEERTKKLQNMGYKVVRLWEHEIKRLSVLKV